MHVWTVRISLFAALLAAALVPSFASAQERADDAIRSVIASAYIHGIHENGSREDIRAGFHPDFVMKVYQDGAVASVTIEDWIARLPAAGTPPEHEVSHRVPDVSISGRAAVARVEVMFDGRLVFTDYMNLYRFPEGWRIVAKIFNAETE